jgi:hypothetical protein
MVRDVLVEGLALDVLHGDVVNAFRLANVMYGDDVGMVQGRSRTGLPDEAPLAFRVSREFTRAGS